MAAGDRDVSVNRPTNTWIDIQGNNVDELFMPKVNLTERGREL